MGKAIDSAQPALAALRSQWNHLYREKLPCMARQRDSAQPKWPVFLDHCFARIILDNAVGDTKPWTEVVRAPATKNMTEEQLRAALSLGAAICSGDINLEELDDRSLELRGKTKSGNTKRKRNDSDDNVDIPSKLPRNIKRVGENLKKGEAAELWAAFSASKGLPALASFNVASEGAISSDDQETLRSVRKRIETDPSLSIFRRRTLTLLTQIPCGRFTTYQELANGVTRVYGGAKANARAIGGAMRTNPFAPEAPCHRVLASDRKLGGFKGDWGDEGRFANEKIRLLRGEGVKFDGKGKVIGQPFTQFEKL